MNARLEEIRARVEAEVAEEMGIEIRRHCKGVFYTVARRGHELFIVEGQEEQQGLSGIWLALVTARTELAALREENARLRGALLTRQKFMHNAQAHQWHEFEKCDHAECTEARELAALSPSPAKEQTPCDAQPKQD